MGTGESIHLEQNNGQSKLLLIRSPVLKIDYIILWPLLFNINVPVKYYQVILSGEQVIGMFLEINYSKQLLIVKYILSICL